MQTCNNIDSKDTHTHPHIMVSWVCVRVCVLCHGVCVYTGVRVCVCVSCHVSIHVYVCVCVSCYVSIHVCVCVCAMVRVYKCV